MHTHSQLSGRFSGSHRLADGAHRSPRILWRLLKQCSIQAACPYLTFAHLTLPVGLEVNIHSVLRQRCTPSQLPKCADHAKQSPLALL